ncbi:hypothetical protein ACVBEQ_11515 [Nakamurella sp. GG22]
MRRARNAAGALAAVTIGAAALLITFVPAQAAPNPPVAAPEPAGLETPVSTANGTRTLVVDSTTGLPVENASIAVQGKGFDVDHGLFIAVCQDGSGAPETLTKCVGGPIPDGNTTTGWAHITADGEGAGGVKAAWGPDGSFSVTLALPKVDEGDVNCVTGKCSLYTASDDDSIRAEDNAVPLAFAAPPTSSSEPPPTTPSSTAPTAPGTAIVQVVQSASIVAGGTQLVVFSGFQAGEQVNLTLFSAPLTLSPVQADETGVARAEFVVPPDFAAGTHRLEAIGQESRTVGVASFQVTAPPVSTSSTPSSTPSSTSTPSSSSSPSTSSPPASSSASSSAAPSTAVTPTAAAGTSDDDGSSLWWLWLILGIVALAAIITGIVVYRRNKEQQQRERDEQEITDAAAREQAAGTYGTPGYDPGSDAPTVFLPPVAPGGPPAGADPYGLLSGREDLYPGGDPAGPTEILPPADHNQGRGPYGSPLGEGQGEGYRPPASDPASDPIDGPGTQAWTPDEDDTPDQPPSGGEPGPDQRR